jgi:hypothetical protein
MRIMLLCAYEKRSSSNAGQHLHYIRTGGFNRMYGIGNWGVVGLWSPGRADLQSDALALRGDLNIRVSSRWGVQGKIRLHNAPTQAQELEFFRLSGLGFLEPDVAQKVC